MLASSVGKTFANNGERIIDAEVSCRFNNDGHPVGEARIQPRGVEPRQRVAAIARGPCGQIYVDDAVCAVDSPLQWVGRRMAAGRKASPARRLYSLGGKSVDASNET